VLGRSIARSRAAAQARTDFPDRDDEKWMSPLMRYIGPDDGSRAGLLAQGVTTKWQAHGSELLAHGLYVDIFRFTRRPTRYRTATASRSPSCPTPATVLDALEHRRRRSTARSPSGASCRSASAVRARMNINGTTGLACKTPVRTVLKSDRSIAIDPMAELPADEGPRGPHGTRSGTSYTRLKPF